MMQGPMDLELLNGLGNGNGYYNQLAGPPAAYNQLAAIMGMLMGYAPHHGYQGHHGYPGHHGYGGHGGHPGHGHHPGLGLPQGYPQGYGLPQAAMPMPMSFLNPAIAGVAERGGRVQPLGFTNGQFTATSGTSLISRATPQRPVRGGRLFGSLGRNGTSATGLVTLSQLIVGTDGQLLSGDPISFDMLAPNSFGAGINITPAVPGVLIQATVQVSTAPAMTDTIDFNLTLVGPALG